MQPNNVSVFLMTACLILLVAAEQQSAYTASSNFDASPAQTSQQQQQSHQQLQQQLSSRLRPSDEQTASSGTLNNASRYQLLSNKPSNSWYDSATLSDNSFSDGSFVNDNNHVNKVQPSHDDDNRYNLKTFIEDLLHIPVKSNWLTVPQPNDRHPFRNNYLSGYVPLSPSNHGNDTYKQRDDHRVDKREATDHLTERGDQTDPELLDDYYPILLERRFQVFRSNDPYSSSPYLSPQEFKETFRRSDPYVIGKRTRDLLSGVMIPLSAETRAVPKFVGRRDPPYFVGKRETLDIPDSYLAELGLEEYESPLSEDKRAAPKFIGRRGAPYFVGKRRAPMFVGKRVPIFDLQNDDFLSLEDKRGAPRFVGKRRAPFFVGKREYSHNLQDSWSDLSSDDDLDWLLEKKGAPKFVGRRGAPYFVGKRGPPMFIGKRATDSELDSEPIFGSGQSEVANLLGRRGSPYFVGKRGAPRFVGKRWAEPNLQEQAHSSTEDKRRAPKFVGRRGSPYFVGKRGPKQFGVEWLTEDRPERESQTLLQSKRGAPAFVGKRRAPYFVGKRGPPKFVGKRLRDDEWSDPSMLALEVKQNPVQFTDRRAVPYFVGKKGAPMFVGKRVLNSLYENNGEQNLEYLNGNFVIGRGRNKAFDAVGNHIPEDNDLVASSKLNSISHPQRLGSLDRLHVIGNLKSRIQANTIKELNNLRQSRD